MDPNQKPRHERILDRMHGLVRDSISKISINAEGGLLAIKNGDEWNISGSPRPSIKRDGVFIPWVWPERVILEKSVYGIRVMMGSISGRVATIGGFPIYGSQADAPKITDPNCDVYVRAAIALNSFVIFASPPPSIYALSDMTITSLTIETLAIGSPSPTVLGTVDAQTGATTDGDYYFYIGTIEDGEVTVDSPQSFIEGEDFGVFVFKPEFGILNTQGYPEIEYINVP